MTMIKLNKDVDLSDFTLIIPSVSVGNVPQLTIDLLISNYKFEKIGLIWHESVIPLVAPDPFDEKSDDICTACELYANRSLKIVTLQNRTSFHYKLLSVFIQDLKNDIIKHKFNRVVCLASAFDHELHKIDKGKLFYIDSLGSDSVLEQIGFQPQQPVNDKYIVQGGGYCTQLYEALRNRTRCTVLIKYVAEGNNTADSISMLALLSQYIPSLKQLPSGNIEIPHSWSSVFGPPPPTGMY
ncbi:proteasome assembly chaperone 2-like [Harmonia axyridis]|uniref:proteasome assembly chaperone 2-like n=1 Tax=Harmonia axyridis TaxID=115357 RepID=UPI001E2788D3|nr:proteasome assembly chaperone 2-like [Harmonia axyridis]